MPEQLPVWLSPGVEPPESLKTNGWQPGMKPAAQHFDWLFNRIYAVLKELQDGGNLTLIEQKLATLEQDVATHKAEDASLANKGHVQLSNATNSTSETMAATPKSVKAVNDVLSGHVGDKEIHVTSAEKVEIAKVANKYDKSGGTVTGNITVSKGIPNLSLVPVLGKAFDILYNANNSVDYGVILKKEGNDVLRINGQKDVQFFGHDDAWMSLADLKSSVSSGKAAVANATTQMGVQTAPDAEFATIAANIRKIVPKPKTASGSATTNQYGTLQINGLGFKPTYVKLIATYSGNQREQHYYYPLFGAPYTDGGNTVYPTYGQSSQISTAYAPGGMYEGGFQLPTGITSTVPVSWLASDGILF